MFDKYQNNNSKFNQSDKLFDNKCNSLVDDLCRENNRGLTSKYAFNKLNRSTSPNKIKKNISSVVLNNHNNKLNK